MSQLGTGVMLRRLCGNADSVSAFERALKAGKITSLRLDDNALRFEFEDGFKMRLHDAGQSCCESRYMKCDDDLEHFVGAKLKNAEVREAPSIEDQYGEHEVAFLVVETSKGSFTANTHVEHNGYYGGFSIECVED